MFLLFAGKALSGNDRMVSADMKTWRDPDHDAANVLYVFLRIYGLVATYHDISGASPSRRLPRSLQDIKAIAEDLGCPLTIRRLSPEGDLKRIPLPVITFLEGETLDKGRFVLLLEVRKSEILFMEGASAMVKLTSRESFFRRWNGIVAFPAIRRPMNSVYVGVVGFMLGAVMLRRRFHSMRGLGFVSALGLSCVVMTSPGLSDEPAPSVAPTVTIPTVCADALKKHVSLLQTCKVEYDAAHEYALDIADQGHPTAEHISSVVSQGRYYQRCETTFPEKRERRIFEVAYDGKIFYTGSKPGGGASFVTKYLGDNPFDNKAETQEVNDPYFESVGFVFPLAISDWRIGGGLSSFVLRAVKEGTLSSISESDSGILLMIEFPDPVLTMAQRIDLDRIASPSGGRPLQSNTSGPRRDDNALAEHYQRLRSRKPLRKTAILLDGQKGYALKRREDRTSDGELIFTTDCTDFKLVDKDGLWLPQSVTKRIFVNSQELLAGFSSSPKETVTYKLQRLTFDVPADVSYSIEGGPGAYVTDRSVSASKQDQNGVLFYQVPFSNDKLREAAIAQRPRQSSWRWYILIGANVFVFAVLAVSLLIKSRAKRV